MMLQPLVAIFICLIAAYVFSGICKKIGLPRAVGQLFAGLLLGIGALKSSIFTPASLETLSFLANLGIILLFYYVGLEINFRTFQKNLQASVLISLLNTALPLLFGFFVMKFLFDLETITSVIIGLSLSVSAQTISVDLLEELKLLRSKFGSLVISAGTVDDIIEVFIVTLLLSIFQITTTEITFGKVLWDMALFIAILIASKMWLIPATLRFFEKERSSTARFTASLIIVLLIASLAETLGMGLLIGALLAGIIVRQTLFRGKDANWKEHDIAHSVHVIAFGFLIPLFFVWTGIHVDLAAIPQQIWFILLLVVIALGGTIGGTMLATRWRGGSWKEGLALGWGLSPKGDIELVIAAVALRTGILSNALFTSLVVMSLITMIIAPPVLKRLLRKHSYRG